VAAPGVVPRRLEFRRNASTINHLQNSGVESRRGAVAWAVWQRFVSSPRSSNRTGQAMASGSRTRPQTFALGKL
jgi:hypothetical protein